MFIKWFSIVFDAIFPRITDRERRQVADTVWTIAHLSIIVIKQIGKWTQRSGMTGFFLSWEGGFYEIDVEITTVPVSAAAVLSQQQVLSLSDDIPQKLQTAYRDKSSLER